MTSITMANGGAVVLDYGTTSGILFFLRLTPPILCSAGTRVLARMTVLVLSVISDSAAHIAEEILMPLMWFVS
ncbi:hypothetical protein J3R82DRAFT_9544 [Butyriboletus roseoflavus]|nr:hypothetical protein J3R82DRAFT_9544 [Butyriboletus roseoflavus]